MKLTNATLDSEEQLTFGDFNVFIGGNGVGKTTIISELFHKSADLPRTRYWWIKDISYVSSDVTADLSLLKGSLARKREGLTTFFFSNAAKSMDGNVDLGDEIRFSTEEVDQMASQNNANVFNHKKYRRSFIAFSSCESRLSLQNESAMTRLDHPPQDPLNILDRNKILLKEIDKNIFDIFKFHFVLLTHLGIILQIGISKTEPPSFNYAADSKQEEFERIEKWRQENFTPITEAGHGIRSMIRLLTSLLEPVNQIIVIDEPEMHLYPSQKRWLGKQLVSLAAQQRKQVFLVTHDPMVLQGILDANTKTNIFRVDRDDEGKGTVRYCEFDKLDASHSRNQDQYLQGLFYQRCIVVEGASDRSFYQEMLEQYPETQNKDLGIVVAGGVGNSKHMAYITAKVGLRAAFVYDLDVILENRELITQIYITLGGAGNPMEAFEAAINADAEVQATKSDKKKNQEAAKQLTGYTRKEGFSEEWASKNRDILRYTFGTLASRGLFIVPYGTLESWAPEVEEKIRFAEEAPAQLRKNPSLQKRFDDFATPLLKFLDIDRPPSGGKDVPV